MPGWLFLSQSQWGIRKFWGLGLGVGSRSGLTVRASEISCHVKSPKTRLVETCGCSAGFAYYIWGVPAEAFHG